MKKVLVSSTVMIVIMVIGQRGAEGAIAGTPHDMSAKGWGTTELCKFCHTPHLAQPVSGAPLWNHKTTTATYTLYTSSTQQGVGGQPGATSLLCLSCHDGTVAIDSFANNGVLQTGTRMMPSTNQVGGASSLASDHPIAFTYDAALVAADTAARGGGAAQLATPASASVVNGLPLFSSKLECATCHNSHDNTFPKFLRISNGSSAMCLKCHIK
jgi:predicted CXXCH cytochrome family protein